jgi:hypothetical protein
MVDLKSSSIEWLSRHSNSSESDDAEPNNENVTTILIFVIFAVAFIVIILVIYRVYYKFCMSTKQKNRQKSIRSRPVSSLYASPVRSNTISDIIEELPPSYHSAVQLQATQSDPIIRL